MRKHVHTAVRCVLSCTHELRHEWLISFVPLVWHYNTHRDQARAFSRNLCVQVLRRHMLCPGAIVPRIKRELPVGAG